ncbi:MAG: VWA domain-containing protein [Anaerolineae bacterium]|nr:VWA domain-containing protein [Anaerolineae bacterium]
MKKGCRCFVWAWMVFVLIVASAPAVQAGDGTYTAGTPDEIVLNVAFQYDEPCFHTSPVSCPAWETLFKEGSKLLYDGTEKQVRISKVRFYNNCLEANAKADVHIYNDTEGARAHVGGLGVSGTRIRLSQTHKTVTTGTGTGNRGQFGLVHEMGHYVFGLLDEYQDKSGNTTSDAYCIDETGTTASIMDGGTTVNPTNRRTEFCWSGNHRTGHTEQDKKRTIGGVDYEDTDCWTFLRAYIQDRWGAALTLPTTAPTSDVSGHTDPTFEYYNCGVRAVTCIDRSGSMAGDPLSLAKMGASTFVNLTQSTDELAVTSYSDYPRVDFAMATMTDANKTAAKAAIDAIVYDNLTNIGGGLQTSLDQITAAGSPLSNEVIILLSDGMHNTGTDPDLVLPAIKARNVNVYTIGLGSADASLMRRIATETGGNYIYASNNAELQGHFQQILAEMRNNGLLERVDGTLGGTAAGGRTADTSVLVDAYTSAAGQVTFILAWNNPSEEADLVVRRPNGVVVSSTDAGVQFVYDSANASKYYRITSPEAGEWLVSVSNAGTTSLNYSMQVHGAPSQVLVRASASEDTYTYPEPMLIQTTVLAGEGVMGAAVTAEVVRPALGTVNVPLFDDGLLNHGDTRANDGVYSNYFSNYAGDGSYVFNVTVDAENAYTNAYVEEGGSFTRQSLERFVRETQVTSVLSGSPSVAYAYVYLPLVTNRLRTVSGFDSQFNGSADGWETHSGTWAVDSNYLYTYGLYESSSSASYAADYVDVDYSVSMRRAGCSSCANRIYVRGTVYPLSDNYWNQYYSFQYNMNGSYSVWARVGGVSYALQPWTDTLAINQGESWNTLRVVAAGGSLYYYINGNLVWLGSDYSLSAGRAGLGMYRDDTYDSLLQVDWAVLSTLSTTQLETIRADRVSAEQQALNDAALQQAGGDENMAAPTAP